MWIPLVLTTAFFASLQDVIGKKVIDRVDPYVLAWSWFLFSLPLLTPCLLVDGVPPLDPQFWWALGFSTILLAVASIFYFKAIKYSDLSIAVPMRALTPLFLLITSPIILGEFPGALGISGIILIVFGSYILHLKERRNGFWGPFKSLVNEKGSRYMLMVAVLFSISGNLDKVGVVHSSPFMWLFSLNFAVALVLGVALFRRPIDVSRQMRATWPFLLSLGLCSGLGLIFQMISIEITNVPYLIAVKRTSVLMTSLLGIFIFKEKGLKERIAGVILMILGVFVISFFQ